MGVPVGDDARRDADSGSGRKSGYVYDEAGLLTTKAAVIAWIGVAALIVGSFSSIMWGWPIPLDGSGDEAAPMSASADKPSSVSVADQQMSGRFEVGKDGKLLRPSSAPIPWQPQLPQAAREETPEGMEAFTRYVLKLVPYMWMSGNTEPLENLALPTCSWCQDLLDGQEKRKLNSAWVETAGIEIVTVGQPFLANDSLHVWHVDLEMKQLAMTVYDGTIIREYAEEMGTLQVEAQFADGRWKLYEVGAK